MISIQQNLQQVRQQISMVCLAYGRDPTEVTLLAVSKTQSASVIEKAIAAGHCAFGENYVQEGVSKIEALATYPQLEWHFIGALQSNKSRMIAEHFAWCHTVDSLSIAKRLNEQRPAHLAPLNVLIQINISEEQTKSGIMLNVLPELAYEIDQLPGLQLRGLMAIPAAENDYFRQLAVCQQMASVLEQIKQNYPNVDTLSLGMSNDMDAAIAAGSTMIRIGTAIFGKRHYANATGNNN